MVARPLAVPIPRPFIAVVENNAGSQYGEMGRLKAKEGDETNRWVQLA